MVIKLDRCVKCQGRLKRAVSPFEFDSKLKNDRIVVDDVVVWECENCGERFVDSQDSAHVISEACKQMIHHK